MRRDSDFQFVVECTPSGANAVVSMPHIVITDNHFKDIPTVRIALYLAVRPFDGLKKDS